ncbi:hypothetical protein YT1_3094 [Rhodococcus ruber]|nr:hypothetical protein YT1_3094 [Rhodococcus ruber]
MTNREAPQVEGFVRHVIEFLQALCEDEIARRETAALAVAAEAGRFAEGDLPAIVAHHTGTGTRQCGRGRRTTTSSLCFCRRTGRG